MSINDKKAQIWITDFIIAFLIFSIGLVLASRFITNAVNNDSFDKVKQDAETISEYLLSEGVPKDWNESTVVRIGLTTPKGRMNTSKLERFYNLSYKQTKTYLSAEYDYQVYFQKNDDILNLSGRCSYGAINFADCTVNFSNVKYDDLAKVTRLIVFNSSIIEMVVYSWD